MTPLLDSVIEVTGYNDGTALWRPGSSIALASDIERKLPDLTVPLDAIYVQNRMPLIYFTAAADNETDLRHLHQQLWNYNQGFLLVAVQQETAHFVDCFQAPSKDPIIRSVPAPTHPDHVTALLPFSRGELLSGRTTAHFPWFSLADRVDRHLFNNLEGLRNRLQNAHLDRSTANALVIRSLLIRYLEDRHALSKPGSSAGIEPSRGENHSHNSLGHQPFYRSFKRL